MDQTIRLRSSHVGISMCLRLIGYIYIFYKFVQCFLNNSGEQLVIFRNSDGKVLKRMGHRTATLSYRIV